MNNSKGKELLFIILLLASNIDQPDWCFLVQRSRVLCFPIIAEHIIVDFEIFRIDGGEILDSRGWLSCGK